MKRLSSILLLPLLGVWAIPVSAGPRASERRTVLFLCAQGGVKSVMAAAYFNRLAQENSLPYVAVSAAAEDPYPAVPEAVIDFLHAEGVSVRATEPRCVEEADLETASNVITIGCDLAAPHLGETEIERWDDVPRFSDDPEATAAAIQRHVATLFEVLSARR